MSNLVTNGCRMVYASTVMRVVSNILLILCEEARKMKMHKHCPVMHGKKMVIADGEVVVDTCMIDTVEGVRKEAETEVEVQAEVKVLMMDGQDIFA